MNIPNFDPIKAVESGADKVEKVKNLQEERQKSIESSSSRREEARALLDLELVSLGLEISAANQQSQFINTVKELVKTLDEKHIEFLPPKESPNAGITIPKGVLGLALTERGIEIKVGYDFFNPLETAQYLASTAQGGLQNTFFKYFAPALEKASGTSLSPYGVSGTYSEEAKAKEYAFRTASIPDLRYFPYKFEDIVEALGKKIDELARISLWDK